MKTYRYKYFSNNNDIDNSYTEPRVLLRERIIDALNHQHIFTDDELYFIACVFPDIVTNVMNPSENVIKAYIKAGNPLSKDTFPASVWNNDELVFFAAANAKQHYLPSAIHKKITLESITNYINTHSYSEIAAFYYNYKTNDKRIKKYLNSKEIQKKIEPFLLEMQSKTDYNRSEDEFITYEQENYTSIKTNESYSLKTLTLLPETSSTIPIRRQYKMDEYMSARFPRLFHYVTDIHLTNKIYSLVEQGTPLQDAIDIVIDKSTKSISTSLNRWVDKIVNMNRQILLIGGDVSFDFEISKQFFTKLLSRTHSYTQVYVTLGNHELWDGDPEGLHKHNYKNIVNKYRDFFSQYNRIRFLENELAVVIDDNCFDSEEYILNEEDLFNQNNQEQIKALIDKSRYLIFGGIGFAGMNDDFNAQNGIYRNTVTTRKQEQSLSKKCEKVFKKCIGLSGGKKIICLTHMPPSDWMQSIDKPNCYYIYGHTHHNYYDAEKHLYADNQIGYLNDRYSLKQFSLDIALDKFESYSDGIHLISNYDYYEYALGIGLHFTCRESKDTELYLLKKDGIYMFVSKAASGLCILNGGGKRKLKEKDLTYYYDNLGYFADAIRLRFTDYNDALKAISKQLRVLGANGKIHGCIVDIDFYNHVYLNPFDGKVTYYCAPDMTARTSYDTLQELLENNPSESLTINRMNKRIQSRKSNDNQVLLTEGVNTYGTAIYSPSRVLNKIQKLFDYNILQIWDEDVLNQYKTEMKLIETHQ